MPIVLIPQLREVFLTQPTETWLSGYMRLISSPNGSSIPANGSRNVHVEATKAAVLPSIRRASARSTRRGRRALPVSPRMTLCPAPDIGQDSREVLLEAGFDRGAIDDLIRAGAVRQASRQAAVMSERSRSLFRLRAILPRSCWIARRSTR